MRRRRLSGIEPVPQPAAMIIIIIIIIIIIMIIIICGSKMQLK
jgi:hypothetical protein